jgi:hypothetical protein
MRYTPATALVNAMSNEDQITRALANWHPARLDALGTQAETILDVTRQIVAAANADDIDKARIAAGYVCRYLDWINSNGETPTTETLTVAAVDDYLEHLRAAGMGTGSVNSAASYLRRCATDGNGLARGARTPRHARSNHHVETASERIATYTPIAIRVSAKTWPHISDTVRRSVSAVHPASPERASALLTPTALYTAWVYEQNPGLLNDTEELFSRVHVERFIAAGTRKWSQRTASSYAASLRTVAWSNAPQLWTSSASVKAEGPRPMSLSELAETERAIQSWPTTRRRAHLEAAYLLGRHAGIIGIDAARVTPDDISDDAPVTIAVTGQRARHVIPAAAAGSRVRELADLARLSGDRYLIGGIGRRDERQGDLWRAFAERFHHVEPLRLRATYLAELVSRPLPLRAMLDQAGVRTADTLVAATSYADAYDHDEVARVLARGEH